MNGGPDIGGARLSRESVSPFAELLAGVMERPFLTKAMTKDVIEALHLVLRTGRPTGVGEGIDSQVLESIAALLAVHDQMLTLEVTEAQKREWRGLAEDALARFHDSWERQHILTATKDGTRDRDRSTGNLLPRDRVVAVAGLVEAVVASPHKTLGVRLATGGLQQSVRGLLELGPHAASDSEEGVPSRVLLELFALLVAHDEMLDSQPSEQDLAEWTAWANHALGALDESVPTGDAEAAPSSSSPLEQLDQLTGISEAKRQIRTILDRQRLSRMRESQGLPPLKLLSHMAFVGPPGTGKTTVARLLAELLCKEGLLTRGHLVEVSRDRLVAGYLGQTAIKTRAVLDESKGGVLFLDEAYSLSSDDYGAEAVATLLKGMEESDMLVILAGYDDDMAQLWASNPGLRSRVGDVVRFEAMTPGELKEVFDSRVGRLHLVLSPEADDRIVDHLEWVAGPERDEHFGNAREVVNLVDDLVGCQANRIARVLDQEPDLREIVLADVECAVTLNV